MSPYQEFHKACLSVLSEDHALQGEEAPLVHPQGGLGGVAQRLVAWLEQLQLVPGKTSASKTLPTQRLLQCPLCRASDKGQYLNCVQANYNVILCL